MYNLSTADASNVVGRRWRVGGMSLELLMYGAFCLTGIMLGIFVSVVLALSTFCAIYGFIEEVKVWRQQKKD